MSALFETTVAQFTARLQGDLTIKGFHADGIFGNLGLESGGFEQLQEGSPTAGEGGYGWAQWTGPRRRAYLAFCSTKKLDPRAPETNYAYLVVDFRENFPGVLAQLRLTHTRDEAVDLVMNKFEIPGKPNRAGRIAYAVRAQAARVTQEAAALSAAAPLPTKPVSPPPQKGPTMTDITSSAPAVAAAPDTMTAALQTLEDKLLAFATTQMTSHGVPAPIAAMIVGLADKLDLPQKAEDLLRKIDIEKIVVAAVSKFVTKAA